MLYTSSLVGQRGGLGRQLLLHGAAAAGAAAAAARVLPLGDAVDVGAAGLDNMENLSCTGLEIAVSGLVFLAPKVVFSWPSLDRIANVLGVL